MIVPRDMDAQASRESRSWRKSCQDFSRRPPRPLAPLLSFSFLCLLFLPAKVVAQEKLKLSYERAQQLFERGANAEAARAFGSLLAQTYQARAALEEQEGSWNHARDDLAAALGYQPDSGTIRYELAHTDFRLQNYPQAASELEQLAQTSSNNPDVHALLGRAYFSLGRLAAAGHELQRALRLNPNDPLTAYTLALVDLSRKDRAGADQTFAQLGKDLGTSARFHLAAGRAYSDAGYQTTARRELRRALAIDPKARYAHYLLAVALLRESGASVLKAAQSELDQERRLFPDEFEAQYLLGVLLTFQRRWDDAGRILREALQLAPQQPETYFYLGNVYLDQGDARQAIGALQKGLALAKQPAGTRFPVYRAHLLLSRAYRALGDRAASEREAKQAAQLSSAEYRQENEITDTDARLRQSLAGLSAPAPTVVWRDPTPSASLTPEQQQFMKVYGQVVVSAHNYLGLIAARNGMFGRAADEFEQVRNLQPDFPAIDFRLGLALFKGEQFVEASKALDSAVAQNPSDRSAQKYLGFTYFELGDYDQAVRLLEKARAGSPDDAEILLALGGALARSHHDKEAQNVFAELLKSHPNSAAVHMLLGKAYASQGQTPQAEQEFERALELDPHTASAHLSLGILKLQRGQLREAGKEFQAELEAHPDAWNARYDLAFVLLKQQQVAEAMGLLRQVIQENPLYADAHYSLGTALLQEGDTPEALAELKTAVQLDPQKAYAHYQLGRAYLLAGQRKEAEQEFELTRNLKDKQLKLQVPQSDSTP